MTEFERYGITLEYLRDINAAKNILAVGLDRLGAGIPPLYGGGGNQ